MRFPTPPSAKELATPDAAEFKAIAEAYFATVDPNELTLSITPVDLAMGVWRPFGFLAIHALSASERWQRQLRVHIWQAIDHSQGAALPKEHPHKHGAHLAALIGLNTYAEQLVIPTYISGPQPATHAVFERYPARSSEWSRRGNATVKTLPTDEYHAGATHFVPADAMHKTLNDARPTALTFVLRGTVQGPEVSARPIEQATSFPDNMRPGGAELENLWNEFALARQMAVPS
jgi:hypothetical protein